jgi:hypothetical protein
VATPVKVNSWATTYPKDHGCKAAAKEYGKPVKCVACPRPTGVHDSERAL